MNSIRNSVTIVGGGASGWMTALYLNKWYNEFSQTIDITVIESKDIGILGVGEATVHSLRHFFNILGIDERDILKKTNGTLKTGILFRNWMKSSGAGLVHDFFHPFESQPQVGKFDVALAWLLDRKKRGERFDEGVSASSHLIKHDLGPKASGSNPYEGLVSYAYHIDATLMARYLRDKAKKEGVQHIEATVSDVVVSENNIKSVITEQGEFFSDFFIDCSGFRSMLIERLQEDNWRSFEDALPCNKAVAIQTKFKKNESARPYTTATGLSNGWAWEIDLSNRRGNGYVYDGRRISEAEAEAELMRHIGENSEVISKSHLNMKIGCRKEFWVGNCLAIGLAGGFIEPLESTGLHLVELGARLLSTHSPLKDTHQSIKNSYNKLMNGFYDSLKEFIVLHYCLTNRDDTEFWQYAQTTHKYCEGLTEKLELWKHKYCEKMDMTGGQSILFVEDNYRYVLYGMGYFPVLDSCVEDDISKQLFSNVARYQEYVMNHALKHREYIDSLSFVTV